MTAYISYVDNTKMLAHREISLMSEPEAKHYIQKFIVSQYEKDQLVEMGWIKLKNIIDKTYHIIKKPPDTEAQPPPSG